MNKPAGEAIIRIRVTVDTHVHRELAHHLSEINKRKWGDRIVQLAIIGLTAQAVVVKPPSFQADSNHTDPAPTAVGERLGSISDITRTLEMFCQ